MYSNVFIIYELSSARNMSIFKSQRSRLHMGCLNARCACLAIFFFLRLKMGIFVQVAGVHSIIYTLSRHLQTGELIISSWMDVTPTPE